MSSIKGGGRAPLSENAQEMLVDLLMEVQKPKANRSSKSERKKFVKKLKEKYQRAQFRPGISSKNPICETKAVNNKTGTDDVLPRSNGDIGGNFKSIKVRIELVEAVEVKESLTKGKKDKKEKEKKAKTKSQISKQNKNWRLSGKRKTLVMERSTTVNELFSLAKNKLKVKNASHCFYQSSRNKSVSIQLNHDEDLSCIDDGDTIYVASFHMKENNDDDESDDILSDNDDNDGEDSWEKTKLIYIQRLKQNVLEGNTDLRFLESSKGPISFLPHIASLPQLSDKRKQLPICAFRDQILCALDKHQVIIICGSTGCGKSTQVPQFILEGLIASKKVHCASIYVTQPRRIAAIALAERVAFEQLCQVGDLVGYSVRLDSAYSSETKILYCTVGLFLRKLMSPIDTNELFTKSLFLVIDEVHERSIQTDITLAILRFILPQFPHIRLILMSATSQSTLFQNYFHDEKSGIKMPIILNVPGKIHPVTMNWLNDCERKLGRRMHSMVEKGTDRSSDNIIDGSITLAKRCRSNIDNSFVSNLTKYIVQQSYDDGHILIFLPGSGEIDMLLRTMENCPLLSDRSICHILKLHSSLPRRQQNVVFQCVPEGVRKIILATNCAETSLTIPDVTNVIDTGRVKECRFSTSNRVRELVPVWTSRASAVQRSGRAGRTREGICWRLYSEEHFLTCMMDQTSPEILIAPLEETVLLACLLEEFGLFKSTDTQTITAIEFLEGAPGAPAKIHLERTCQHLCEIGALEMNSNFAPKLTQLGWHLSQLPMDASIGKLLLYSVVMGCLDPALTLAATLSCTKSIFLPAKCSPICRDKQNFIIENGFGGSGWRGGTVKADFIAAIAAFNAWFEKPPNLRGKFARSNFLDNKILREVCALRAQFKSSLQQGGFIFLNEDTDSYIFANNDNALYVSCCIAAGLFPNVASLVRDKKKGAKLLTRDGEMCTPDSTSFQRDRIKNAKSEGRDIYATYMTKFSITSASETTFSRCLFLTQVNFVSRYALILFGGNVVIKENALIIDNWLKFKVGREGSKYGAFLIHSFRQVLDNLILRRVQFGSLVDNQEENGNNNNDLTTKVMEILSCLLREE